MSPPDLHHPTRFHLPAMHGKENEPLLLPLLGATGNACSANIKGMGTKECDPNAHPRGPFCTMGNGFLPQVIIPKSHPQYDIICVNASTMRSFPGYVLCRTLTEWLIYLIVNLEPKLNSHVIFTIAKCTTVWLELSMEAFTYTNPSANLCKSPSVSAQVAFSDTIGSCGLNYHNNMCLGWINA